MILPSGLWGKTLVFKTRSQQLIEQLQSEIKALRIANARLSAKNDSLIDKVLALASERAYLLTRPEVVNTMESDIQDIEFTEWGEEVMVKRGSPI